MKKLHGIAHIIFLSVVIMTSGHFLVAKFCLCVSLNNLYTLSVQLFFNLEEYMPFVEFAKFGSIFCRRGFAVNFLFLSTMSGRKLRKTQPGEAGPYPLEFIYI